MARLIRKQVYIDAGQDRLLKARARELGVSEASVIRRCLADELEQESDKTSARRDAWTRLEALMKERAMLKVRHTARAWTREELYDERPKYLSRRH